MLRRTSSLRRRRPRTAALVLALVAFVLGAVWAGYGVAFLQWKDARQAVKENRPADAKRSLDFCLIVWPRSTSVHLLAARAARLEGDFDRAESHLNRCLKLNPSARDAVQLEFLLMRVQAGDVGEVEEP